MNRFPWTSRVLLLFASLGWVASGFGQTPKSTEPPGPEAEASQKFQAYAKACAGTYEIRAESADGRKLTLGEAPNLRRVV